MSPLISHSLSNTNSAIATITVPPSNVVEDGLGNGMSHGRTLHQIASPLQLSSSIDLTLLTAVEQSYQELLAFGNGPDFETQMAIAFGSHYDATAAQDFFTELSSSGAAALPRIAIASDDILNGANGVYIQGRDQIYLSHSLAAEGNVEFLTDVLLEELGHRLDAQINDSDSLGDEGQIFSKLVQGESLSSSQLDFLRQDNDQHWVSVDGQWLAAEASRGPSIIWRNSRSGDNVQWLINPTGVVGSARALNPLRDPNWQLQATGDFNRDGHSDQLWRHQVTGGNVVHYLNGNSGFLGADSLPTVADVNWEIAAAADFDRDGDSDILWRNQRSGSLQLWYMNGAQTEGGSALPSPDPSWDVAGAADFDGDDKPDLLLRNQVTGANIVWKMNGPRIESAASLPTLADQNWQVEGIGDFNQDGHPDLFWRNRADFSNVVWTLDETTLTGAIGQPSVGAGWQPIVASAVPAPAPIQLTSFNQNTTIVSDVIYDITWTDQLTEGVRIDLYKAGERQRTLRYTSPGENSYTWDSLPDRFMPEGNDYQLRISSREDSSKQIFSPYFTVQQPSLQVLTPGGGESLQAGREYEITWTSNVRPDERFVNVGLGHYININLYQSGQEISTQSGRLGTENDGSFTWRVPDDLELGADYQIELSFNTFSNDFPDLSQNFTIQPKADLDIQLFNYNNTFTPTQWQALNIAAENWERLITRDKEPDGNFRVVAFGSSNLGSRTFAGAFQDNQSNGRTNFSNDNTIGTVDIGGIDYDNSVVWNLDRLPELNSSDLIKIMMHELGHALGISHEFGTANSLMDREYDIRNNEVLVITETTFSRLEQLGYRVDRSAVSQIIWSV